MDLVHSEISQSVTPDRQCVNHLIADTLCPAVLPMLIYSWRSTLILSSHLCVGLPSVLLPSGLPTKILYALLLSPIHASCRTHFILLDMITRIIFGEEHRSLSSSLCILLHSSVTFSLLGPNILFSTLSSDSLSLCSSKFECFQKLSWGDKSLYIVPVLIWAREIHHNAVMCNSTGVAAWRLVIIENSFLNKLYASGYSIKL